MADPTNVFAMDDIKFMTGYNVEPVVASEIAIEESIDKLLRLSASLTLQQDGPPSAAEEEAAEAGRNRRTRRASRRSSTVRH